MSLEYTRDYHTKKFAQHVEGQAEVFWMSNNPLSTALERLHEMFLRDQKDIEHETITYEKIEKCFKDVYQSCDRYLATYYDLILVTQRGRGLENRDALQDADRSRRNAHVALTTNIRVLARALSACDFDTSFLQPFVLEDDMDSRRTEIGNYALALAFARYVSS